ncbi:MAG TPA: 50S ribosomal protein L24 [Opitutaceae bacterium]|nr:50S ribosomal protein L24 [Opitutaceae bacterium]
MQKFHVKRGDSVVVLAGSQKGKSGKVLEILAAKSRARVEGLAMIKRHEKKSEKHPQGTISEREGSIHVSNLMLQSNYDASTRRNKNGAATAAPAAAPAEAAPEKKAKKPAKKAKAE